jgi:hypothetical protein
MLPRPDAPTLNPAIQMKPNAPNIIVDLKPFDLDFMRDDSVEIEDDEEEGQEYSRDDALDEMQSSIPESAIELGTLEDEVENFTTWVIKDHYYVIPWEGAEYDWALFRISWDDNWGRYGWNTCSRVCGVKDYREAARTMLKAVFENWGLDLNSKENRSYRNFIARV